MAAADPRQSVRRNRGPLGIRFTARSGSGFQPAMLRAICRACPAELFTGRTILS